MLIVIGLIAWIITKAITDGRIDHTYARQGLVSPRLQAKYGSDKAARQETAGYGLFGHIRAAWLDYWPRRTQALIAARDAKAASPGEPVRWRDRWAAATKTMAAVGRKLVEPVPTRAERQPAESVEEQPADPAPALAVDTGDVPPGTIRHIDTGREQWDGGEWRPVEPNPRPRKVGERHTDENGRAMEWDGEAFTPVCRRCDIPMTYYDLYGYLSCARCDVRAVDDVPDPTTTNTPTEEATAVSDFEATNFETAVPALNALTQAAQNLSEHVAGAKQAAATFHDQIDEIEQARDDVEKAAATVMEQLAARNLDADTMGQVTAAMEQIRAGDLSAAMDMIDAAAAKLAGAETAAVEASGAAAAASATVVSKYGDAASTVASELSGDASFLHSGGGSPTAGSGGFVGGDHPAPAMGPHGDGFGEYPAGEMSTVDKATALGWEYWIPNSYANEHGVDAAREMVSDAYAKRFGDGAAVPAGTGGD